MHSDIISLVIQIDDVLTQEDAKALRSTYKSHLEDHLIEVSSYKPSVSTFEDQWGGMVWPASVDAIWDPDTGVDRETLKTIARASVKVPDEFVCGPTIFHTPPSLMILPQYRRSIRDCSVMSGTVSRPSILRKGLTGLQRRFAFVPLIGFSN